DRRRRQWWWTAILAVTAATALAGPAAAQAPTSGANNPGSPSSQMDPSPIGSAPKAGGIIHAGCKSCSDGLLNPLPMGDEMGGCPTCCYPGRKPCDCCLDQYGCVGRMLGGIYECICCPDPCYEPHWVALADAALFTDGPRPMTQMRIRYDTGWSYLFPDKAEY